MRLGSSSAPLSDNCLFREFSTVRRPGAAVNSASATCVGTTWWYVLQTHRLMNEFTASDIRRHPSLIPVFTAHLDRNRVTTTSHASLVDKVRMVDIAVAAVTTAVNRLNVARGNQAATRGAGGAAAAGPPWRVSREGSRSLRNTLTPLSADLEPDINTGPGGKFFGGLLGVSPRKRSRTRTGRFGAGSKRLRMTTDSAARPLLGPRDLYSRDGVMRGVRSSPSSDKLRVGIVAQAGWTGWHPVAAALDWKILWVAAGAGLIGQAWRHELGSLSIPVPHLLLTDFSSDMVAASKLDLLLIDGRHPHSKSSAIWTNASLRLVLGTSSPRRGGTASGWSSQSYPSTHSNCGGVSSASGMITYVGPRSSTPLALSTRPCRQLSSILSTTEGGWATPSPDPAPLPPQVT